MNKCQFCQKDTDNPNMFLPMTLPIPRLEEKIDELGREDWWVKLGKDPSTFTPEMNQLLEELNTYDQLLSTIGRGYSCNECYKLADELFRKYYPQNMS